MAMRDEASNKSMSYGDIKRAYNDSAHPGNKSISVSNIINRYGNEFDAEFWSRYKALERLLPEDVFKAEKKTLARTSDCKYLLDRYNISEVELDETIETILDEWEEKAKQSKIYGNAKDIEIQTMLYEKGDGIKLEDFGTDSEFKCIEGYDKLDLEHGIYPEFPVSYSDGEFVNISGRLDLLVKDGDEYIIIDHKTNREIKKKSGFNMKTKRNVMMKAPLSDVMDCNFYHYTLQLSFYQWILEKSYPGIKVKSLYINHYDHDGNHNVYKCDYMKSHVEAVIRDYKRDQELKYRRRNRMHINY